MELLNYLGHSMTAQVSVVLIIGLLVGSFLNVVILRLPIMMFREWKKECAEVESLPPHPALDDLDKPFNLIKPDSHCPGCHAPVKAWQNIPVISYLLLKGRCENCHRKIGFRYPAVEIATALLSTALVWFFPWGWPLAAMVMFTWLLVTMSVIDMDHKILPDTLTLGLLWLGLIANSFELFTDLNSAVWGAVAGYLSLWSVFWLFKLITGKEGMGYGDFKLLAALGAWLGFEYILMIILLSSVVGAVIGIAGILIQGRDKDIPIPFGPYLAAAGWIAAVFGDQLMAYWLPPV
ncbi:MAG: prepilin peptidase [Oceanospirillaceae bacterium]|nr:prepilin peptidase [Oceanospirillaceae bacterium]|tara:strand:+ start:932 stop:1807 length:876 start_codon:yes stop_codon:yes gene_type:complete